MTEFKPFHDRKPIRKLLKFDNLLFPHYDILAKTRSRQTTATS